MKVINLRDIYPHYTKAGGKDAQSDPRPGKQEIRPGESQSRGGGTALYEAERGRQEGGGWH